jgi:DNA excision repair protein ERCC-4
VGRVPVVHVDERERNSKVPQFLMEKGVTVIFKFLDVGDYVVSDRIGIERKTAIDFAKSIVDGRLFDQASRLLQAFEKAIIVIEGGLRKVARTTNLKRSAIIGAYIALALDMNITVLNTRDEEETAEIIKRIALKEFRRTHTISFKKPVQKPTTSNVTEWQLYVLQAFPHIGPKIAIRILERFGSLVNFCNATLSELTRIEGLSENKATEIYRILHAMYKEYKKEVKSETPKSLMDYLQHQEEEKQEK